MYKNVHILGVGSYHPQKQADNQYYIEHFKKFEAADHAVNLFQKLGRETRTLATEEETSLTMAVEAAKNALDNAGLNPEDIDMIISVSDTPEYLSPCCALLIKNQINAVNAHAVFDMNANCIGMLTAMDTAVRYMKTDERYHKVLIIGSLLISPQAREDDLITFGCTGDGAAAIILESREEEEKRGFLGSRMFTDDQYYWSITMPACGISKIADDTYKNEDRKMLWKPFDFSFLSEKWAELIANVLKDHGFKPEDTTHYFMSQFSYADLELTIKKLGSDMDKVTYIGDKYGYTGCTSPIMALADRLSLEPFHEKDIAIFCSVASGYSMAALLYQW